MPSAAASSSTGSIASPRVVLARLALEAALAVPGVVAGEAGRHNLRVTVVSAGIPLRGVSVTAERGGRYAVDLCLVARMTPLIPLADAVRRRVIASAARQGLADQLGTIDVEFAQVLAPGEDRPAAGGALTPRAGGPARGGLAAGGGGAPRRCGRAAECRLCAAGGRPASRPARRRGPSMILLAHALVRL